MTALLRRAAKAAALLGLAGATLPALALYKVVGPDGRVTYTDRPPAETGAKITPIGPARGNAAPQGDLRLPFELRQIAARFPVTLYSANDCAPCDAGRTLLQQRGVPYTEKRIASDEDAAALERLAGGRTVPTLAVGTQLLRGFTPTDWSGYLDLAGYPKESRLPAGWQAAPATPLVERAAPPAAAARPPAPSAAAAAEAQSGLPTAPPPPPAGIRF